MIMICLLTGNDDGMDENDGDFDDQASTFTRYRPSEALNCPTRRQEQHWNTPKQSEHIEAPWTLALTWPYCSIYWRLQRHRVLSTLHFLWLTSCKPMVRALDTCTFLSPGSPFSFNVPHRRSFSLTNAITTGIQPQSWPAMLWSDIKPVHPPICE